jgi:hypothetical protein
VEQNILNANSFIVTVFECRKMRTETGRKTLSNNQLFTNYQGYQIKEDEMGGVRGKFWVEGKCIQDFVGKTFRKQITWDTMA